MKLLVWIDRLTIVSGKIVSFLIWVGIAIVVWEVVARYLFNAPTAWAQGYMQRTFTAYFILIGAYTLIQGGHVRVDLLQSKEPSRKNAFLDIPNYMLLVIWGGALTWEGWTFLEVAWDWGEVDDSALRHPMWPVWACIVFGAALITLQGIAELLRSFVLLINPNFDTKRQGAL